MQLPVANLTGHEDADDLNISKEEKRCLAVSHLSSLTSLQLLACDTI